VRITLDRVRIARLPRRARAVLATGRRYLGFGEVGGIVIVQPGRRVDVLAVGAPVADLEMQMRARRHAAAADVGAVLARTHRVADGAVDAVLPSVRVGGRDRLPAEGVLDDDEPAVSAGVFGDGHGAV